MSDKTSSDSTVSKTKNYILISLFTAIIAVCSFITVPAAVPFTLQTLGVFAALAILGGKRGTLCIILYVFTGLVGLPVFSGFSGGVSHLLGATGGYISGFILCGLCYWIITKILGTKTIVKFSGLLAGLVVCYLFGTLWYTAVYLKTLNFEAFVSSAQICVLPFIIPDLIKIVVVLITDKKLPKTIK